MATLLATPFTIRALGAEQYGLLTLIGLLIGYASIADIGMGSASTKFAAEAHAQQNPRAEAEVIWTSILIALLGSLVVAGLLVLAADRLLAGPFNLSPELRTVGVISLRLAAVGMVARSLANVLNTAQLVRLRLDINAGINSGTAAAAILLNSARCCCWGEGCPRPGWSRCSRRY